MQAEELGVAKVRIRINDVMIDGLCVCVYLYILLLLLRLYFYISLLDFAFIV